MRSGIPFYYSDLTLFHTFEEIEHGMVTVQTLRPKTNLFMRILVIPLLILVLLSFFIFPVLFLLLSKPIIIFYPSTYV